MAYLKTEPGPQWAAIGHNFNVDSYTGGYHLFGSPPDRWYGISGNDMRDYAFQASFTTPQSVPEPSSILGIMAIGLLELKLLLLYKRNKRVPNTRLTAPPPVM